MLGDQLQPTLAGGRLAARGSRPRAGTGRAGRRCARRPRSPRRALVAAMSPIGHGAIVARCYVRRGRTPHGGCGARSRRTSDESGGDLGKDPGASRASATRRSRRCRPSIDHVTENETGTIYYILHHDPKDEDADLLLRAVRRPGGARGPRQVGRDEGDRARCSAPFLGWPAGAEVPHARPGQGPLTRRDGDGDDLPRPDRRPPSPDRPPPTTARSTTLAERARAMPAGARLPRRARRLRPAGGDQRDQAPLAVEGRPRRRPRPGGAGRGATPRAARRACRCSPTRSSSAGRSPTCRRPGPRARCRCCARTSPSARPTCATPGSWAPTACC